MATLPTKPTRNKNALSLDDEFHFGRYKGEQVEDIVVDDPEYIGWLCEEEVCEFDEEVLQLITKLKII